MSNELNLDSETTVLENQGREGFIDSLSNGSTEQPTEQPSVDTQTTNEADMSVFDVENDNNNAEQSQSIEIDEKFRELPKEEAILRTLQSQKDKYASQVDNLASELEVKSKYESFYNDIMTNDDMLLALVKERKPELLQGQQNNITEKIQQKLTEEFEDYKPTKQDAEENPGGKAWLYYKRLDELYSELKNSNSNSFETYNELKEKQMAIAKEQKEKAQMELDTLQRDMKWDKTQLTSFHNWASKLSVTNLAKMYRFAMRTNRIPNGSEIASNNFVGNSRRNDFLNSLK